MKRLLLVLLIAGLVAATTSAPARADTGCEGDLYTSPGFVGQSYGHTVVPCVFSGTVHYSPYYHLYFRLDWSQAYWVPY